MNTIIRGKGDAAFAWYHVVDYKKRDGGKHFSRGYFVHIGNQCLSFSLSLRTSLALISVEFASTGDDDFSFCIALYKLLFFSFAIAHLPIVKKLPGVRFVKGDYSSGEREIRLSWRPWSWHWNIWTYPGESKRSWRDNWFDLTDFLLGRQKYSEIRGDTQVIVIPMPEGLYPAKLTFVQRFWKRPRWHKTTTRTDADIEMFTPIPIPGKGENSWDCEDDALFGMGCRATTIEEAIEEVRASVFRDRKKYGGENWLPS